MMNSSMRRIFDLGRTLGILMASAAGCFAFMPGFRLLSIGEQVSSTKSSICVQDMSLRPLAGISGALFLLAFVASEALATLAAFRH
jgi:hypothetical protein